MTVSVGLAAVRARRGEGYRRAHSVNPDFSLRAHAA